MVRHAVVLGGGTGGTLAANRLRRLVPPDELSITVVDADDRHLYQPGLLFVPFGMARPRNLVRSRRAQLRPGIGFREAVVDAVDLTANQVHLGDGSPLHYDVLLVASGARLVPAETEGLVGPGWMERVFTFYELGSAGALAGALARLEKGRLVVGFVDLPIKCPVAPLEFSFLADWYLRRRGVRGDVDITFVTPLDGAFTKPVAAERLGGLLAHKGISLVTECNIASVDGTAGSLRAYDGREIPFDVGVIVPLHEGAAFVGRSSGLGDELGFVECDPRTLQAKAAPNVFVIGDAADVPTSKAGSVAHFEGEVVVENIRRFLQGEPLAATFDGHANCFVETGFGKALLADFNYDTEPLPGRYPADWGIPLLEESRLCHLGKRAFEWVYWHALLRGIDLPGVASAMPRSGKALARPVPPESHQEA
jgi:sulfide:quinone oxidoreductase